MFVHDPTRADLFELSNELELILERRHERVLLILAHLIAAVP